MIAETDPNGLTTYSHFDKTNGQLLAKWGATYPSRFEYNSFGQMTKLHTLRDSAGTIAIDEYQDFLNNATAFDSTTWTYDSATGLQTAKAFADGKGPAYTYTNTGKLLTRTWARTTGSNPLVTTYGYDPNTGRQTSIDYSDATPDVSFTYTRNGRVKTVTDGIGTRTFNYDAKGILYGEQLPSFVTGRFKIPIGWSF